MLERIIKAKLYYRLRDGPTISDEGGRFLETRDSNTMLVELLIECYQENQKLFLVAIDHIDKIIKCYQWFRAVRSTIVTRAFEEEVNEIDVNIVNRWKDIETTQGIRPSLAIWLHYSQVDLLMENLLWYTLVMQPREIQLFGASYPYWDRQRETTEVYQAQ